MPHAAIDALLTFAYALKGGDEGNLKSRGGQSAPW
ncbi:hypothetical protein ACP70R_032386 [Stipagrostis hirtigluma subsp. patula]